MPPVKQQVVRLSPLDVSEGGPRELLFFHMFAFKKKEKDGKRGGGERENRKMRK